MLARIRSALGERAPVEIRRAYRTAGTRSREEVLELLVERVRDYGAEVVTTDAPASAAAAALVRHGARRVGVPDDLPGGLRPPGFELVDAGGLAAAELDRLDGALTACAAACAETGSLAFDGGPGTGSRALTLVPDLHVCVVRAGQVVETVPELVARLEPSAREGRPIVIVSGPSATSDIELNRVEGVHGPRRLVVVVDVRLDV
jgi:L-lactate dehydrogenase complex protein LldG